jgi:hypothetical protein
MRRGRDVRGVWLEWHLQVVINFECIIRIEPSQPDVERLRGYASLLFLAQPVAALEKRLAATAITQTTCRTYITTKSTTATTSTTSLVLNLNPIVLYTKTPSTTVTPQATTSKIFLIAQTIGAFMLTLRNNYNSHIHGYYHRFCGDRYVQHHQYHHRINN